MHFTPTDLAFHDYKANLDSALYEPKTTRLPDVTPFNRMEEAEVLYLINHCYKAWNWPAYTKEPGRKLERLMRLYLPLGNWTQAEVMSWIRDNWRHYWNRLPSR